MTERPSTTEIDRDSSHAPSQDALNQLREEIDACDDQILALLNRRARLAKKVGALKDAANRIHYVPTRERDIFARLTAENPGPFPNEAIRSVYGEIISASRSLERTLMIAHLGPLASYSHVAGLRRFGSSSSYMPCGRLSEVFHAVEKGEADYGVAAIENSTEGVVNHTLDLFLDSPVKIYAEVYVEIVHCLLARCPLDKIRVVYSHDQALAQCRVWLERNLPAAKTVGVSSTTHGVERALSEEGAAAVASRHAADHYEIPVVAQGIQDILGNTTRFVVIGRDENPPSKRDKTSLIVFTANRPGALHRALESFKQFGINLTNIHSRPKRQEAWQYAFFIDLEGHVKDKNVCGALRALEENSFFVKPLGSYPSEM